MKDNSGMNPFGYKWIVQIKTGFWMGGTHRFRTRKEADEFVRKWQFTHEAKSITYDDIPVVRREKK